MQVRRSIRAVSEVGEKHGEAMRTVPRRRHYDVAEGPFLLPSRALLINGRNVRAPRGEGRRLPRAMIDSGFSVSSRFVRSQRATPAIRKYYGCWTNCGSECHLFATASANRETSEPTFT